MRSHLAEQVEVEAIDNVITQQMGGDVMWPSSAKMSSGACSGPLYRVERGFRLAFPEVRLLSFVPDVADCSARRSRWCHAGGCTAVGLDRAALALTGLRSVPAA
jgi:hypothetical protein